MRRFVKNVGLTGLSTIVAQGLTFLLFLIAARFVGPADFGVYAIAALILAYSVLISEFGGGAYLIYREGPLQIETTGTLLILNQILSLVLAVPLFFAAEAITGFFGFSSPELIQLACCVIPITSLSGINKAILQKALKFKFLAALEIIANIIAFLAGWLFLILGEGIISLVIFNLVRATCEIFLFFLFQKNPYRLFFTKEELSKIYEFSVNVVLGNIFIQLYRSFDQLLVGKNLGDLYLGFYSVAYKIMLFPVHRISGVVAKVMYPTLARSRDNMDALRLDYVRITSTSTAVVTFLFTTIALHAEVFVSIVLGSDWNSVAELLVIFAPVGVLQSVLGSVGPLFMLMGRTAYALKLQIASTLTLFIFVLVGVNFGVVGVCWAYLAANLVLFLPIFKRSVGVIELEFSKAVVPIAKWSCFFAAAPLAAFFVMQLVSSSSLVIFIGSLILSAAIAATFVLMFQRSEGFGKSYASVRG